MLDAAPKTLLRDEDKLIAARFNFEKMIREAQDSICKAVEELDGGKFREDAWSRPGGGGGISRVLQDSHVFEKAGVNVSVVYGMMPPDAYRAATGNAVRASHMFIVYAYIMHACIHMLRAPHTGSYFIVSS